jgi:hypothetical protein
MARPVNLPTQATRTSEVGLYWVEILTNASGSIVVPQHTAIRVRAAAATTVSFDGELCATMGSGEILVFNSGNGGITSSGQYQSDSTTLTVSGNCYVQMGLELVRNN